MNRFGIKLFLSYLLFTLILLLSIALVHFYFSKEQQMQHFVKETRLQVGEKKEKFDAYINSKKEALIALSQNEQFLHFAQDPKESYFVDLLFLTLMQAHKEYMQMRYINKNGKEVLRYERALESQKPKKIPNLQDKAERDYFQEVSKMAQNAVYISDIDLNIEHEKVEIPHKTVVRFATPIYHEREFMGIFIINVFMDTFLQNFISSTLYDISLINEEGRFLKHLKKEQEWMQADVKKEIKEKKHFMQTLFVGVHKIEMLVVENDASIQKTKSYNNKMIGVILLFAVIMALLFTALFTNALKNIFDLVALQAQRLDTLLQNQSKLAELGEMVANIAHQWRQPLTRVSLILQNLKAYKAKAKMSDALFDDSMQNALAQIEFMSNTIDNFRDFYRSDTHKETFFIQDALESVLNIIGESIKHSNITLSIHSHEKIALYANKNEFSQVLLNLIVNAKDAIWERAVQDGKIDINIREENGITIEVCDNAMGVADEIKEKIFDPYFSTKRDRGTGIGLYLAKTIIEKTGGKLSVKNSQEGAVFTIEHPSKL